jgi:hypothetical protein
VSLNSLVRSSAHAMKPPELTAVDSPEPEPLAMGQSPIGPVALLRGTHVASEWSVIHPGSKPSAEITSYKPTSQN